MGSLPRPKILTLIEVPTGGWTFQFKMSAAGAFDTTVNAVVPAGNYYLSGDRQDDDLLHALATALQAGVQAVRATCFIYIWIDTSHKVNIACDGAGFKDDGAHPLYNDAQIVKSASSAGLMHALGWGTSSNVSSAATDNPVFTAEYQHGYGWYAEEDGQIEGLFTEDVPETVTAQSVSDVDGGSVAQYMGEIYRNKMQLVWLDRDLLFSGGADYGDSIVYPYVKNKGLECWWRLAREGRPFRLYNDWTVPEPNYPASPLLTHVSDSLTPLVSGDTTDFWISAKTWDAGRWTGCHIYCDYVVGHAGYTGHPFYAYVEEFLESIGAGQIFSLANSPVGWAAGATYVYAALNGTSTRLFALDHTYKTYVLDLASNNKFAWTEYPGMERYNISFDLLRYVP